MSREERTGWRDERLSAWHRQQGRNLPALDLDFCLLEYDGGKAVALVEYKHERAAPVWPDTDRNLRALADLADRAGVVALLVRYADDLSWFKVAALNTRGRRFVPRPVVLSADEYRAVLYRIRGRAVPAVRSA